MELWPGIHSLDASRISNVYLVTEPVATLVDTGPPGALREVLAALRRAGLRPHELRRIVLTHCDVDHVGNARALQRLSDAEVCAHEADVPYITGARPTPGPAARRLIAAVMGRNMARPEIDRVLRDGDDLDGLTVLHLPGHTPGHIGLRRGRVLFAGDTVAGGRRLRPAPRFLTWDQEQACRSIARMAALGIDLLLPGHGTPVNDGSRHCAELIRRP